MERNGHILFPTVEFGINFQTDPKLQQNGHHDGKHKNGSAHESNGKSSECESRSPADRKQNYRSILRQCLLGHAPYVTQILTENQSFLKWAPLVAGESILRSVSNITLVSNPMSGLLILIAMFIATPTATSIACITLFSGLCTSLWFGLPLPLIRCGAVTFNSFLLGLLIGAVSSKDVLYEKPEIIIICVVFGALTIIVWIGFNGLLSLYSLPVLNAPANILGALYLGCGITSRFVKQIPQVSIDGVNDPLVNPVETFPFNDTMSMGPLTNSSIPYFTNPNVHPDIVLPGDTKSIIWGKVFEGVFMAENLLYGTNTPFTLTMVYIAVLIYSPILFTQGVLGSAIGTLMGVLLSDPPYTTVYSGGWAYNCFLISASLGGLFLILNVDSWFLSCCTSVMTALLYAVLEKSGKPILGWPFMLMTWMILLGIALPDPANQQDSPHSPITRMHLEEITTPEIHLQTRAKYNRPRTNSVRPTTNSSA